MGRDQGEPRREGCGECAEEETVVEKRRGRAVVRESAAEEKCHQRDANGRALGCLAVPPAVENPTGWRERFSEGEQRPMCDFV